MIVALPLHLLAVIVWVGGMFFAHQILRPSTSTFEPPVRLAQWRRVFARFFPWVWVCVLVLLASGYAMVFIGFQGFGDLPLYVHIMQGLGLIMMAAFAHLFAAPWKRFRRAVDGADWAAAGAQLNQIRAIVTVNLALGIITVVVAASGRVWG